MLNLRIKEKKTLKELQDLAEFWGYDSMMAYTGRNRVEYLVLKKLEYEEKIQKKTAQFENTMLAITKNQQECIVERIEELCREKHISKRKLEMEAGLGTGSIAHACADTKKPVKQGFFGIFEVFVDTIVICTLTALVILCSGVSVGYGEAAGAELTISGFTSTYGGWVSIFTAVAMCCFAFSTIIGWGLYGTRCIEFLFGTKANKPFMVVYSLVAIVGATMNLGLMWSIAETFNGLMVIPNLIAVFLLSGVVVKLVKEYFAGEGAAATSKNSREEANI